MPPKKSKAAPLPPSLVTRKKTVKVDSSLIPQTREEQRAKREAKEIQKAAEQAAAAAEKAAKTAEKNARRTRASQKIAEEEDKQAAAEDESQSLYPDIVLSNKNLPLPCRNTAPPPKRPVTPVIDSPTALEPKSHDTEDFYVSDIELPPATVTGTDSEEQDWREDVQTNRSAPESNADPDFANISDEDGERQGDTGAVIEVDSADGEDYSAEDQSSEDEQATMKRILELLSKEKAAKRKGKAAETKKKTVCRFAPVKYSLIV